MEWRKFFGGLFFIFFIGSVMGYGANGYAQGGETSDFGQARDGLAKDLRGQAKAASDAGQKAVSDATANFKQTQKAASDRVQAAEAKYQAAQKNMRETAKEADAKIRNADAKLNSGEIDQAQHQREVNAANDRLTAPERMRDAERKGAEEQVKEAQGKLNEAKAGVPKANQEAKALEKAAKDVGSTGDMVGLDIVKVENPIAGDKVKLKDIFDENSKFNQDVKDQKWKENEEVAKNLNEMTGLEGQKGKIAEEYHKHDAEINKLKGENDKAYGDLRQKAKDSLNKELAGPHGAERRQEIEDFLREKRGVDKAGGKDFGPGTAGKEKEGLGKGKGSITKQDIDEYLDSKVARDQMKDKMSKTPEGRKKLKEIEKREKQIEDAKKKKDEAAKKHNDLDEKKDKLEARNKKIKDAQKERQDKLDKAKGKYKKYKEAKDKIEEEKKKAAEEEKKKKEAKKAPKPVAKVQTEDGKDICVFLDPILNALPGGKVQLGGTIKFVEPKYGLGALVTFFQGGHIIGRSPLILKDGPSSGPPGTTIYTCPPSPFSVNINSKNHIVAVLVLPNSPGMGEAPPPEVISTTIDTAARATVTGEATLTISGGGLGGTKGGASATPYRQWNTATGGAGASGRTAAIVGAFSVEPEKDTVKITSSIFSTSVATTETNTALVSSQLNGIDDAERFITLNDRTNPISITASNIGNIQTVASSTLPSISQPSDIGAEKNVSLLSASGDKIITDESTTTPKDPPRSTTPFTAGGGSITVTPSADGKSATDSQGNTYRYSGTRSDGVAAYQSDDGRTVSSDGRMGHVMYKMQAGGGETRGPAIGSGGNDGLRMGDGKGMRTGILNEDPNDTDGDETEGDRTFTWGGGDKGGITFDNPDGSETLVIGTIPQTVTPFPSGLRPRSGRPIQTGGPKKTGKSRGPDGKDIPGDATSGGGLFEDLPIPGVAGGWDVFVGASGGPAHRIPSSGTNTGSTTPGGGVDIEIEPVLPRLPGLGGGGLWVDMGGEDGPTTQDPTSECLKRLSSLRGGEAACPAKK